MNIIIGNKIRAGLNLLFKHDNYLLINNVNERSITHKLGEHYQNIFWEWNVDCEFDRNLGGPKVIKIDAEELLKKMAKLIEDKMGDNSISELLISMEINREDIRNVKKQLSNPLFEYDEELEVLYHVIKLRDGKKLKKKIQPDIIVHNRGTKRNLIVLEVKKSINNNQEARFYDLIKLLTLVDSPEYQYKYGIFINIPVESDVGDFQGFHIKPMHLNKHVVQIDF